MIKFILPIIAILLAYLVFKQKSLSCSGKPVVDDKTKKILKIYWIVVVCISVLIVIMLWPAVRRTDEGQPFSKTGDCSNLRQIGLAMNMYLLTRGGNIYYAPSLKTLYETRIVSEQKTFTSYALRTNITNGKFVTDFECILDMVNKPVKETDTTDDTPLAWNKKGTYHDGARVIVYFNAKVEICPSEKEFQKIYDNKILPFVEAQKKKAAK